MAAPVPETDNGLPRRTALQPAVANSPPAGGEAPLTTDAQAKRPDPFAKPSLRPAPATKPAPVEAPAAAAASTIVPANNPAAPPAAAPTAADWGLTPKSRPGTSLKLKIASLLGLLASAGGSYFGYQQYFPASNATDVKATDANDQGEVETANAEGDADDSDQPAKLVGSKSVDPFDDPLKIAGDDDFEAPTGREPRRVGTPSKAAPITRRAAPLTASQKRANQKLTSKNDDSFDLDDDSDDSSPPRITQTEPEIDDDDLAGPALERPTQPNRKSATAGRYANRGTTTPQPARRPSAGPRIQSINDRDLSVDDNDDLADDKMDGYDLPELKTAKKTASHVRGPKINVIDVRDEPDADERLEGFTTEDATTRRAVAKTRIVRSTSTDDFDDNPSAADADADLNLGRSSRSGATPIRPRGSAPPDSRIRANRLSADEFAEADNPVSETYRIQANDNFWKISRKIYGSARYYQALLRHNRDRVSDPEKIRLGTQISTPPAAYLERHYSDLIEKSPAGSASHQTATNGSGARPRFEHPAANRGFDEKTAEPQSGKGSADGYFYSKAGDPMYRIGSDDTLTGIAQRHLGRASRWTEIYEQNQDILGSPDNLTLGTVIRLPSDASRLSLVPEDDRRR